MVPVLSPPARQTALVPGLRQELSLSPGCSLAKSCANDPCYSTAAGEGVGYRKQLQMTVMPGDAACEYSKGPQSWSDLRGWQ